jgi:hypothetical protein
VNSLFCRHNRFTADCPICSKGTVLDPEARSSRPRAPRQSSKSGSGTRSRAGSMPARFTGPYASAGPYEDDEGDRYDVRLEKVPGGVRLAEWASGQIRRRAPVLEASGLADLVSAVSEREILSVADAEKLSEAAGTEPEDGEHAPHGASRGRAGDMQEELRVERLDGEHLRIARWILRPGAGWELQQAPVMLPAARYAEAIRAAAAAGVLAS